MKILGVVILCAVAIPGWAWQSPPPAPAWKTLHTAPIMGKGGYALAGPVNAVITDPIDPQTFYIGTLGGVWKTTDGGTNWQPLTDGQRIDSVLSLAMDPNNSQVIWAGLGHGDFEYENSNNADLLKTSDGGITWSALQFQSYPGNDNITVVAKVAVQPGNSNVLLAGTASGYAGINRSVDGGNSWTGVLKCILVQHLFFDPANGQIAFATCQIPGGPNPALLKSVDGGLTWNGIIAGAGDSEDDVSAGISPDGMVLYFSDVSAADGSISTWRSLDLGSTWQQVQRNGPRQYCFGQAHQLLVSPRDNNTLLRGCDSIYISKDGGATWSHIAADLETWQNALAFAADGTLITGNNHGVWKTASLSGPAMPLPFPYTIYPFPTYPAQRLPWQDLNATLDNEAMLQQFAVDPLGSGRVLGTSFFNGTIAYSQGSAEQVKPGIGNASAFGADGTGYSFIYYDWGKWWYTSVTRRFNLWHSVAPQDPSTWGPLANYPTAGGWTKNPFVTSPSSPNVLLAGNFGTSGTAGASIDRGQTWHQFQLPTAFVSISSAIDVNDTNGMWLLGDLTGARDIIDVSQNALDSHPTWATCSLPGLNRNLKTDPTGDGSAWVAGEVAPASGNSVVRLPSLLHVKDHCAGGMDDVAAAQLAQLLPNAALFDVAIDPAYPQDLYVASQAGVYASFDGGNNWAAFTTGMPNTVVNGLQIDATNRVLYAATAGRGMWATQLPPAAAVMSITPTVLNFPDTLIGSTSSLTVTVNNTGSPNASVRVGTATGDFTASSGCGATVAANGSCTVKVVFSPAVSGNLSGTLPITVQGPPTLIALAGVGVAHVAPSPTPPAPAPSPDFSLSASQTQLEVPAGQNAQSALTVNPINGFQGAVTFTCAGLPSDAVCSFSPAKLALDPGAGASATLTISPVIAAQSRMPFYPAPILGAASVLLLLPKKRKLLLPCMAVIVALSALGCRGLGPNPPLLVEKTYVTTVTAASGSIEHSITMNVTIQTSVAPADYP